MLLRLDPILGGVPLTISKVKLPQVSVPIFEDQPQLHLDVVCDILLFSPQVCRTSVLMLLTAVATCRLHRHKEVPLILGDAGT